MVQSRMTALILYECWILAFVAGNSRNELSVLELIASKWSFSRKLLCGPHPRVKLDQVVVHASLLMDMRLVKVVHQAAFPLKLLLFYDFRRNILW